jgi:hypothetical protein
VVVVRRQALASGPLSRDTVPCAAGVA